MASSLPALRYFSTLLFICLFGLLAGACHKSATVPGPYSDPSPVDSLDQEYLFDLNGKSYASPGARQYFTFQNGRITSRQGGFIPVPYSAGLPLPYYFSPLTSDTVLYHGDTVNVVTQSRDNIFTVKPNPRSFLIQNGRIQQRITEGDSTVYSYTGQLLSRMVIYTQHEKNVRLFSYNNLGNLQQSKETLYHLPEESVLDSSMANFSGFDAVSNPLQGYGLWDDLFYRSLSLHNFSTYSFFFAGGAETETFLRLQYDSQGKVDFGR